MGVRWGTGLFRFWAVLTVLWVGFGSLLFWLDHHGGKPCQYSADNMPRIPPFECTTPVGISERDATLFIVIFGMPVLVLLVSFALRWALQGFRPKEN
jgi:hypothetical protein